MLHPAALSGGIHLAGTITVYLALAAACTYLLLRLARQPRAAEELVAGEGP